MPLNSTTYLESHGWEGKGVPLDGKQGRGLKKPLALPMKRNLKGLGKDRDRAVEWWDCLFEASAKSISIRVDSQKDDVKSAAVTESIDSVPMSGIADVKAGNKVSLESQAKRALARKMLMSGFVRGREVEKTAIEEELEQTLLKQEEERQAALRTTAALPIADNNELRPAAGDLVKESKEDKAKRRKEKLERKEQKEAKRKRKEAKGVKSVKESDVNEEVKSKGDGQKKRRSDSKNHNEGVEAARKVKKRKRAEK